MIQEYLAENRILIDHRAVDYEQLIESLLARSTIKIDKEDARQSVLERDRLMPTALGKGIAVPRIISDKIERSEIIIAINETGLPVTGMDHKPVKIIFLLLLRQSSDHDAILAQSLRILNDDNIRHEMLQTKRSADVLKLIQRWEQE